MIDRAVLDDNGQLRFECPGCECPHAVPVTRGGWQWNGSRVRPTLYPSVLVRCPGGLIEVCHSSVRDGRIVFFSDCTHLLAGRTVDLPEIEQ